MQAGSVCTRSCSTSRGTYCTSSGTARTTTHETRACSRSSDLTGDADLVNASSFADLLHEARQRPRLVVLNACLTAAESTDDLFSGTAAALVRSGINAVAAMQFAISDKAAIAFARGFYMSLAHGRAIDEAMRSGRIGILGVTRDTLEWVTPVLCVRGDDTRLFDVKPNAAPVPPRDPSRRQQSPTRQDRSAPLRQLVHGLGAAPGLFRYSQQRARQRSAGQLASPGECGRGARRVYAAAAALVLAAAGTAAILLILDRSEAGRPAGNEITAAAPWRLVISNKIGCNGCDVTVTDTDTGAREHSRMSGGPSRSRCSPQARSGGKPTTRAAAWSSAPGPGRPCCPSAQKAGTGDTDVFAAPKAPGKVAVQVTAFNGYGQCDFELHDAADGQLVGPRHGAPRRRPAAPRPERTLPGLPRRLHGMRRTGIR